MSVLGPHFLNISAFLHGRHKYATCNRGKIFNGVIEIPVYYRIRQEDFHQLIAGEKEWAILDLNQ